MLIDNQNREHFRDMTRGQINQIVGGKSPEGKEFKQAEILTTLHEVHILEYKNQPGFSLHDRARLN